MKTVRYPMVDHHLAVLQFMVCVVIAVPVLGAVTLFIVSLYPELIMLFWYGLLALLKSLLMIAQYAGCFFFGCGALGCLALAIILLSQLVFDLYYLDTFMRIAYTGIIICASTACYAFLLITKTLFFL